MPLVPVAHTDTLALDMLFALPGRGVTPSRGTGTTDTSNESNIPTVASQWRSFFQAPHSPTVIPLFIIISSLWNSLQNSFFALRQTCEEMYSLSKLNSRRNLSNLRLDRVLLSYNLLKQWWNNTRHKVQSIKDIVEVYQRNKTMKPYGKDQNSDALDGSHLVKSDHKRTSSLWPSSKVIFTDVRPRFQCIPHFCPRS